MIVLPIGSYFVSVDNLFKGTSSLPLITSLTSPPPPPRPISPSLTPSRKLNLRRRPRGHYGQRRTHRLHHRRHGRGPVGRQRLSPVGSRRVSDGGDQGGEEGSLIYVFCLLLSECVCLSACLPVSASISCWLVLEFSGGVQIPICVSNAYGASRERLQDRTVPAPSPQGHVCVCVEGFLCRLHLCSVNFRGLKVVFSPHHISHGSTVHHRHRLHQDKQDRINTIIRDGSLNYPPFTKLNIKICLQNRNLLIILHDSTSTVSRLFSTRHHHNHRLQQSPQNKRTQPDPLVFNTPPDPPPRVLHVRQVHMTG